MLFRYIFTLHLSCVFLTHKITGGDLTSIYPYLNSINRRHEMYDQLDNFP